ncbi:MAG: hypothetical protein LLG45_13210 [Actinomycetia bacterium]|nr:hypothetical protein [Actinomycetes bacterium]
MDRRPFDNVPDRAILKRVKLEEPRTCAFCGAQLPAGSLADTRDWATYYCNSREEMLYQQGHRKQAEQGKLGGEV